MNEFLNGVLLEVGFDALSINDQNVIIAAIANELGVAYNKVTEGNILDYQKRLKVGQFSTLCDQTIEKGFTATNGHFYRTNRDDQILMIGQKFELIEDATISEVPWKTQDADYIIHSREEWLKVYKEAFLHIQKNLFKYNELRKAIIAAETDPALVAIKWE